MIGAQTERIRIPNYMKAGALLAKISKHVFDCAAHQPAGDVDATIFRDWAVIRKAIASIWHLESLKLDRQEIEELSESLERSHRYLHRALCRNCEPAAAPDCECPIALSIIDFWALLTLEQEGLFQNAQANAVVR